MDGARHGGLLLVGGPGSRAAVRLVGPSVRSVGRAVVGPWSSGGRAGLRCAGGCEYGCASVMDVRLLGPVEVSMDGRRLPLGAAKQRALLAMLAVHANSTVPADVLMEGLWGEEPPATASKMVQQY